MNDAPIPTVRRLTSVSERQIAELGELLIDCVAGGAPVTFMHPVSPVKAEAFWRGVAAGVADGSRALLVAEDESGVVGTVMLVLDLPENQPHRADLAKMLVHRRARRRGLGAALMRAAEATALACGRTLVVLDTATGSDAERLYARLGWQRVGEIPDFSLRPHGGMTATTYFYRVLPGEADGDGDGDAT
jgi:GNAT superfamily N-acetyltransferase